MLTNPNTLGLFEEDILKISEMVHGCGGLLIMTGKHERNNGCGASR